MNPHLHLHDAFMLLQHHKRIVQHEYAMLLLRCGVRVVA